ncbi:hypothetical protein HU200_048466 [Digitaria exilis]|uniref:Polymerase nucleotidyl transferase domain-containing protein n=1 Tax=Digitaria exilis TaxID=1010633 RepID=A0A835E7M5_9POAL|nr:hypothetical protein HU200_048466 [Digitaria exilis]
MVPNGLLPDASAGVARRFDPERWAVAEGRTAELIARIQPNVDSEGRRLSVYHYVQRLIMNCFSCQVFTFGSVPLKAYLPDGDIDVTVFSNSEELKEIWANLVRDALEREEKSENAEFHVKEVQYIQAEVKIIKCLVENIAVDISFNQVGGLCTLCFLEEIDNLISRNHLFKRSIILIKAWCFYESRILGAHHGLISTYALETLILYIFHIYNSSFTGPLEVLYRFLEFFSNFDWEKFCLSLRGPVPISSLPDMTAESPRMDSGELLLSNSFLDTCSSVYGVVPCTQENQGQPFVSKHFNVIDPLRTNNNLGRSVSKGNFFRIRSAFAFGAKRLAKLLECPKEDLIAGLNQFFTNTWLRYGSGSRPDVPIDALHLKVVPSEVSSNHSTKSSQDESISYLNSSSHPSAKEASDSNSVSITYRDDNGFVMNGELPSVSESSDMGHDEQVLVNLMESMELHGFNGQIQPIQIPPHLSVAHSHLLPPAAFSQKQLTGVPAANFFGTPWMPNMQFLDRPPTQHVHNPAFAPNIEDGSESEKHVAPNGVGYSRPFDSEARDPHIYDIDGMEHSPSGIHGDPLERQMEFTLENNGVDDGTSREANAEYSKRSGYVNVPSSHNSSSIRKAVDASSWDEKTLNTTRSSRDKWGKRSAFAAPATATHSKTGWQMGNATAHLPTEVENGPRNEAAAPITNEASEIVAASDSFSTKSRTVQVPNDFDPSQISMPNPVVAPFLIGSPQQRQANSSGLTFGPTDPPVPFVMLPYVPGNSDGSGPQVERSEEIDQLSGNITGQSLSSINDAHQPDSSATSAMPCSTMTEPSGEHKPDILNSDFIGHWHNLQYGRFCQNARHVGPVLYPFPIPPIYFQGHAPWYGPGTPAAPNVNWTQMVGHGQRVFPMVPLQPGMERGTGVLQHYGEGASRYRGGTGTYFPNPVRTQSIFQGLISSIDNLLVILH